MYMYIYNLCTVCSSTTCWQMVGTVSEYDAAIRKKIDVFFW